MQGPLQTVAPYTHAPDYYYRMGVVSWTERSDVQAVGAGVRVAPTTSSGEGSAPAAARATTAVTSGERRHGLNTLSTGDRVLCVLTTTLGAILDMDMPLPPGPCWFLPVCSQYRARTFCLQCGPQFRGECSQFLHRQWADSYVQCSNYRKCDLLNSQPCYA